VLTSAVFPHPVAPFIPPRRWRLSHRLWVGLKGAALSANPDDASTAGREAAEARSKSQESRARGLSECSQLKF